MTTTDRMRLGLLALLLAGVGVAYGADSSRVLSIKNPRDGQTIYTSKLKIEGTAPSGSQVRVLLQRRQRTFLLSDWDTVSDKKVKARSSGSWDTSTTAGGVEGDYRVVARRLDSRGKVIAEKINNFRVQLASSGETGSGDRDLRIIQPTNGERVSSLRVPIAGTAASRRDVRVRVTDTRRAWVADTETVRSGSDGRWNLTVRLPAPGSYRLEVELLGRHDEVSTLRFLTFFCTAGEDSAGSGLIRITQPETGDVVRSTLFYIRGKARRGDDVHVRIYDSRGRSVHDERTRADGSGDWRVRPSLSQEGSYRAVAELLTDSGRVLGRDTVTFRRVRD